MGRGRQKAKHTKIARELKSFSPDVDYAALERELTAHEHSVDDQYAAWADYDPDSESQDEEDEEKAPKGA
ncbi:DUF3073 domain-containing protein [Gryllotalpicola sp.]|uniref:DUF3073 domain-containing protein n=1 Tax=Gryllotalpicola sp. TaxID=1932787 RepID=UPI002638BBA9|nr:DUF3073 domain-containing protein [Gryllotalpicola sp.]